MVSNNNNITVNRVLSYCNFLVGCLLVLLNVVRLKAVDGFFIEHPENSQLIRQHIGDNITLQCSLDGLVDNSESADITSTYNWYFKQCGDESSGGVLKCYDTTNDNEEWTQLPRQGNFYKSELHLKNVTEKYSGLYRCTALPKIVNILDVKLVRTFQLDIKRHCYTFNIYCDIWIATHFNGLMDHERMLHFQYLSHSSSNIPEFLGAYPINKTINKGSQAVFQSRVYSEEYPTIKWFRRLTNSSYDNYEGIYSTVYNNGRPYELLTSTREKPTSRNIYLSKLIINDVHLQDEGFYACVAMSIKGHNIREVYLKVYTPNADDLTEYWSDYNDEDEIFPTDAKDFWLLFLMPVGLALFPLSVWVCYIINKRYRNYTLEDDAQKRIFQENN